MILSIWDNLNIVLRILSLLIVIVVCHLLSGFLKNIFSFLFWLKILGQSILKEVHGSYEFFPTKNIYKLNFCLID